MSAKTKALVNHLEQRLEELSLKSENYAFDIEYQGLKMKTLAAERDGLALTVARMREALTSLADSCSAGTTEDGMPQLLVHHEPYLKAEDALKLEPTAAEAQAKDNAEAAAQVPGLAEQVRVLREALVAIDGAEHEYPLENDMETGEDLAATYRWANALIDCRDALSLPVTAAEAQAAENARKAAEYDQRIAALEAQNKMLLEVLEDVEVDVPEQFDCLGPGGYDDVRQEPNPRYAKLRAAIDAARGQR